MLLCVVVCCCVVLCVASLHPPHPTPDPPPQDPLRQTTQNFALFLPTPAPFSLFLSLCGCLIVEFWWCFCKDRDPQMCTFGLSGCGVKPWRLRGRRGLHTTTRELQTCTVDGPGVSKHHQKTTRRPPERDKESENGAGEGKKSAKFWLPTLRGLALRGLALRGLALRGLALRGLTLRGPTLRGPTLRGPTLRRPIPLGPTLRPHPSGPTLWGPTLRGPIFFWVGAPPHFLGRFRSRPEFGHTHRSMDWPKLDWPKLALAKISQIRMAKTGLAKVGPFPVDRTTRAILKSDDS